MKKNAFTLVELMGVIIIIGILALIAVPAVLSVIKQAHTDVYNQQINSIKMALQNWKLDNQDLLPSKGNQVHLSVNQLKADNYLTSDLIDPRDNSSWPNDMEVTITNQDGYQYNVLEETGTRTDKYNGPTPILTFNSPSVLHLNLNDQFKLPIVTIHHQDGREEAASELSYSITGTGNTVDTTKPGYFYITYNAVIDNIPVSAILNVFIDEQNVQVAYEYGLKWDGTNFTRLGSASGRSGYVGTEDDDSSSDFDYEDIYREIHDVEYDGNAFVYIPKFYIKKLVIGDTWEWFVSKSKKDSNYYLPACFYDDETNTELPYVLVGKYDASYNGTKLVSKSGEKPLVNRTLDQIREYAYANNNGQSSGYQLFDIHALDAIQTLFIIEFGTFKNQPIMFGYVNGNTAPVTSGESNSIISKSGSVVSNTDGKHAMNYRGIENLYGNVWQYIDGVAINTSSMTIYANTNSKSYTTKLVADGNFVELAYKQYGTNGYITRMKYDDNYPFPQLSDTSNNQIVLYGGDYKDGTSTGIISYKVEETSDLTNSTVGCRLQKKVK